MLLDYPDLRGSVNDVSPFQGGRRPQTFQVNLAGPDLNQLSEYADELDRRAEEAAGAGRPRHDALAPQARGPGDRRPRGGQRPGHPGRHDRRHAPRSWSAACRSRSSATGTEQYDVWLRAEAGDRVTRPGPLRAHRCPRRTPAWSKLAQPGEARRRARADARSSATAASGSSPCWATPRAIPLGEAVNRAEQILEGDEPAAAVLATIFSGQAKTMGETGYYFLIAFGLSITVHVPDPRRAVRELDAAGRDPDGLAGDGPVRPALAGPVPHADGHLRDVRPVHAGRDREEERHPPGRRDQPAPREGACRGTRRSSRPTTRGCGRS